MIDLSLVSLEFKTTKSLQVLSFVMRTEPGKHVVGASIRSGSQSSRIIYLSENWFSVNRDHHLLQSYVSLRTVKPLLLIA